MERYVGSSSEPSLRSRSDARPHRHRHRHGAKHVDLPYGARQLHRRPEKKIHGERGIFYLWLLLKQDVDPLVVEDDDHEWKTWWRRFADVWNAARLEKGWYRDDSMDKGIGVGLAGRSEKGEELLNKLWREKNDSSSLALTALEAKKDPDAAVGEGPDAMEDDPDDDYGPAPPPATDFGTQRQQSAGVPSLQDLQTRQEIADEEALDRRKILKLERKADRLQQRERLDDILPRPEAGTRERKLEKKKLVNEKMKGFRERSPGAVEVNDSELMGGGDDRAEYKRMKEAQERRKTEREIRREELDRARRAELEERRAEMRAKEEEKMRGLRELARQRFG
jgi:hypothetical protein